VPCSDVIKPGQPSSPGTVIKSGRGTSGAAKGPAQRSSSPAPPKQ
jgi:hypothetical protein